MNRQIVWVSALVLFLVAGCQSLGIQPQTFEDRVAVAYSATQTVAETAIVLLDAGKISPEDAGNVADQAQIALDGIRVVRQIHAHDPTQAETRLSAVLAALQALDAYLKSRQ